MSLCCLSEGGFIKWMWESLPVDMRDKNVRTSTKVVGIDDDMNGLSVMLEDGSVVAFLCLCRHLIKSASLKALWIPLSPIKFLQSNFLRPGFRNKGSIALICIGLFILNSIIRALRPCSD